MAKSDSSSYSTSSKILHSQLINSFRRSSLSFDTKVLWSSTLHVSALVRSKSHPPRIFFPLTLPATVDVSKMMGSHPKKNNVLSRFNLKNFEVAVFPNLKKKKLKHPCKNILALLKIQSLQILLNILGHPQASVLMMCQLKTHTLQRLFLLIMKNTIHLLLHLRMARTGFMIPS